MEAGGELVPTCSVRGEAAHVPPHITSSCGEAAPAPPHKYLYRVGRQPPCLPTVSLVWGGSPRASPHAAWVGRRSPHASLWSCLALMFLLIGKFFFLFFFVVC